ncbi:uncharacterized protein LOC110836743 [Zootermopsis nevadensis]|uniref:uncharacterized protein LOC110836743 n=1 Tax=Zootermopsis nevadensis TaxID=136037 RepID=UPI000B8EE8C7|nr:uncharacterized protein LOC110836743 [Zootermopsis nevadensis]
MATLQETLFAITTAVLFLVTTMTLSHDTNKGKSLHRERRVLVFTSGAVMQMTIGISTPVSAPNRTVLISLGIQLVFGLPTNATMWHTSPDIMSKREVSNTTLQSIYVPLESFLEGYGFHGRTCVLRSICEAARWPFHFEETHLLDEVMHAILTDNTQILENLPVEKQYLAAECLGKSKGNCQTAYPGCPKSPLDFISQELNTDILVE